MRSRKDPLQPKVMTIPELVAKVYELHPDKKYVFWFDRTINPQHLSGLCDALEKVGIKDVLVVAGIIAPVIYEFKETENGPIAVTKPINPSTTGNEAQP